MATTRALPVLIRNAKTDDLYALIKLEECCFNSDRIKRRSFNKFLTSPSARLLVAVDDDDTIIGYGLLLFRSNSDAARLYSLAVHPDHQGRNIGSQLLGGMETLARQQGCNRLTLEVRKDSATARRLYARHGFATDRTLPGYYEDGHDGIRMVRQLDSIPTGTSPANRTRLPIILVDQLADLPVAPKGARVMTVRDYLGLEHGIAGRRVINLARSYELMSRGYYCSLLAAARKERCIPEADALLEMNWKRIHRRALRRLQPMIDGHEAPPQHLDIYFGRTADSAFKDISRQAFDLFRCPILRINFDPHTPHKIKNIEAIAVHKLPTDQVKQFGKALNGFVSGKVRKPAIRRHPSAVIGILVNPRDATPPSDQVALNAFADAAEQVDARAEFIGPQDFRRLLEFDALFIRETTALNHHTYRFATRAWQEGIPVIDDPHSIMCCTNKIYLAELLKAHRVPAPRTLIFDRARLNDLEVGFDYPGIVKVPDGCFSRGVFKAHDFHELKALSQTLFKQSELLMMQEFLPTDFDWRIGVIDGEPLYACKYYMVAGNWKIADYSHDGTVRNGHSETLPISAVPPQILQAALDGTRLIGNGLYGVDIKDTPSGPKIIEINDNPSIDSEVEDAVLGPALYQRIMAVLVSRIGHRHTA